MRSEISNSCPLWTPVWPLGSRRVSSVSIFLKLFNQAPRAMRCVRLENISVNLFDPLCVFTSTSRYVFHQNHSGPNDTILTTLERFQRFDRPRHNWLKEGTAQGHTVTWQKYTPRVPSTECALSNFLNNFYFKYLLYLQVIRNFRINVYKNNLITAVSGNNGSLFWELYESHKYICEQIIVIVN